MDRCNKAIKYFTDQIAEHILRPLREHINGFAYKRKVKRYLQLVQRIEEACWIKIDRLYSGQFLDAKLYKGEMVHTRDKLARVVSSATRGKKDKGGTYRDTLDLHRQGKTVDEIAAIRNLATGTIKHHLARWIAMGEVDVYRVLPAQMIEAVTAYMEETKIIATGAIRSGLPDRFDYDDIRMIVSHVLRARNQESSP
jgi:hypothetical protein